ncbi:MAG: hypothetical protein HOP28_04050, partial [Gemmatimonadales bacterium]|nr:hypothetical protein [Gemmatimonadales bacterium]
MAATRTFTLLSLALAAAGCAATTPSLPPPEESVVVLNAGDLTLTLVRLADPLLIQTIPVGNIGGTPLALAARGLQGLITTGAGSTVAYVDVSGEHSAVMYRLETGHGAAGVVFLNDSIAYITNPFVNRITRLNVRSGDTLTIAVGQAPMAVAVARGRLFVANANVTYDCEDAGPCILGPSWLTVVDPDRNLPIDSIPLPGPGNAADIQVGADGLLYVLSAGAGGIDQGRLTIVDPVLRQEVGSFSGFGPLPTRLASDGRERLFVTSTGEGLMEFNTRTRRVVRGVNSAIPLASGVTATVDAAGFIYAVESGGCGGELGRMRIFRPDLT